MVSLDFDIFRVVSPSSGVRENIVEFCIYEKNIVLSVWCEINSKYNNNRNQIIPLGKVYFFDQKQKKYFKGKEMWGSKPLCKNIFVLESTENCRNQERMWKKEDDDDF